MASFVHVAPDSDFPIQNLPWGVFSTPANVRSKIEADLRATLRAG